MQCPMLDLNEGLQAAISTFACGKCLDVHAYWRADVAVSCFRNNLDVGASNSMCLKTEALSQA